MEYYTNFESFNNNSKDDERTQFRKLQELMVMFEDWQRRLQQKEDEIRDRRLKDQEQREMNDHFQRRKEELQRVEQIQIEKQKYMLELQQEINMKQGQLQELQIQIGEAKLQMDTQLKQQHITQQQNNQQNDEQLYSMWQSVQNKADELQKMEEIAEEFNLQLKNQQDQLQKRDQKIIDKEKELVERERGLLERERKVSEKERQLKEQEDEFIQKSQDIYQKLKILNEQLKGTSGNSSLLQNTMQQIYDSIGNYSEDEKFKEQVKNQMKSSFRRSPDSSNKYNMPSDNTNMSFNNESLLINKELKFNTISKQNGMKIDSGQSSNSKQGMKNDESIQLLDQYIQLDPSLRQLMERKQEILQQLNQQNENKSMAQYIPK